MFESVQVGHKLKKSTFKRREPQLRQRLLALQQRLLEKKDFPLLVLVNGLDGAGKSETVNLFNEWMDPRHLRTVAFGPQTDWERERPAMWRYWQALPPAGHVGMLFGSWYSDPIERRAFGKDKRGDLERALERIRHFERMLVAEGAVLLKLWFHLSKPDQKERLRELSADKSTSWRVTREEWRQYEHYDALVEAAEEALSETSTGEAPWEIVDGADHEFRSLTAGTLLAETLETRLAGRKPALTPSPPPPSPPLDGRTLLKSADYSRAIEREAYEEKLLKYQGRLNRLMRSGGMRKRSLVVVFEGVDAAGKGSAIRRVTQALDARHYRVIPIAAPSEEERAQPYLWRFWRNVPGHGRAAIFDRSWYGRVLVERIEGFAAPRDWMRAYREINDFEEQLEQSGAIVVKLWLAITPAEQLRRFKLRQQTAHKRYKIGPDDWRNRKKWADYERAVDDMVERTSTAAAPWHIVASDDKLFARIEVLKTLCRTLQQDL